MSGKQRGLSWEGRYAVVGPVVPGQLVQITFPIAERVEEVDIEKQHYILVIKGNDVVSIDPPGRFCPFYQRDHYRENAVRWKKVTRFVSEENVSWSPVLSVFSKIRGNRMDSTRRPLRICEDRMMRRCRRMTAMQFDSDACSFPSAKGGLS